MNNTTSYPLVPVAPDLWQRQVALEAEMAGLGASRLAGQTLRHRQHGRESATGYGKALIASGVEVLTDTIRQELARPGRAGRSNIAHKYLSMASPELTAFVTLKHVINSISQQTPATRVALAIAAALEHEARLAWFEEVNPEEYKAMMGYMTTSHNACTQAQNRWYAMAIIMNRHQDGWEQWPLTDRHHLGMKCLDLCIKATAYVSLELVHTATNKSCYYLRAEPGLLDWAARRQERAEFLSPVRLPLLIPPRDWTGPYDGGYHTPALPPLTLVKTHDRGYLEDLAAHTSDMPEVYASINALQRTPWRINTRVLAVARALWEQGGGRADLPGRADIPLPAQPFDPQALPEDRALWSETQRTAWKTWKRAARRAHRDNASCKSKRLLVSQILWTADKFRDDTIYFPYQLDFRGRLYAVPGFLQPQGSDFAKGLLAFASGKNITLEHGAAWLAIHGANMWGEDKISLGRRIDWVCTHEALIRAIAADPMGVRDWEQADKPWEFLAFCFEWDGFCQARACGRPYLSTLPVAMDGTCNGLQIFSLLLRDPVGGAAVNLVKPDNPEGSAADIYQVVADKVISKLHALLSSPDTDDDSLYLARQWLDFGIDRTTTKRQVMVLPYGGTRRSCTEYTRQYILDHDSAAHPQPWGEDLWPAARFLSDLIWAAIGETVIAARECMSWLQACARVAAKQEKPVRWTSPVGFPVLQAYKDAKERRVKTRLGDSIILCALRDELPTLNRQRQANGVAPNFVHSLDAAALMRSVSSALHEEIHHFAMVHDSYGVLAADAVLMSHILRESFVDLFSTDILQDFRRELAAQLPAGSKLPPTPRPGTLPVEAVLESPYFFA